MLQVTKLGRLGGGHNTPITFKRLFSGGGFNG